MQTTRREHFINTGGPKGSRRSCESCHNRKVRCDVDSSGIPCNNCHLDARRCVIREPLKRGRKSRLERLARERGPTSGTDAPIVPRADGRRKRSTYDDIEACLSLPRIAPLSQGLDESDDTPSTTDVYVPFYFHKFLKLGDMQHLSPTEIRCLEREYCLQVPSGRVLDEFVRQYFLYVHPCLPLLNEGHFWALYSGSGRDGNCSPTFSLALFQAILFTACRFVSISSIKACGFRDLQSARTTLHRRAELLVEHSLERDSVALAQTSLLLSLQATLVDQSLNSMWLSKAISYAKEAGAQNYYRSTRSDIETIREQKRLWWCCILRDRMIALGVRRDIQISPEDFDLEQGGLTESDLVGEAHSLQVYDSRSRSALSKTIVAHCALAVAITWTMSAAYGASSSSLEDRPTVSQLVSSMVEIERANTELKVWSRRFMSDLVNHGDRDLGCRTLNPSVTFFADMTLIHYYSAKIALCNHQASILQRHQVHLDDHEFRLASLNRDLRNAITSVAGKIKELSNQGLAHNLPITAPSCSALPFILEALNLRLSAAAQKDIHQQQLERYAAIMRLFRTQHDHTECVTSAINYLLQVVDSEIQHLGPSSQVSLRGVEQRDFENGNSKALLHRPSTWSDVFTGKPTVYLRLSLSLDFALSRGRAPRMADLQSWVLDTTPASVPGPLFMHAMSPLMMPPVTPPIIVPNTVLDVVDDNNQEECFPTLTTEDTTDSDLGFVIPWYLTEVSDSVYGDLQFLDSVEPCI